MLITIAFILSKIFIPIFNHFDFKKKWNHGYCSKCLNQNWIKYSEEKINKRTVFCAECDEETQ